MNKNDYPQNDSQKGSTSSTSTTSSQRAGWDGTERQAGGTDRKRERDREGRSTSDGDADREMSMEKVKDIGRNLGEQLETQMKDRPYVVLGAVAGAGFVAGSLLGSRLGQIAIALAGGYLVRNMIRGGGGDVQRIVKQGIEKLTHERSAG